MTDKVEREAEAAETRVDDGARRSVPSDTVEYAIRQGRFSGHFEFPGQSFAATLARLGREPKIPSRVPTVWRHLLSSMTAGNPADRPLIRDIVLTLRGAEAQ